MADDVNVLPQTGADAVPIAADSVTNLNGSVVSATYVQRVKPSFGSDGSARDVDATHGLPVELVAGAQVGAVDETAPASDTASSGLNGRLQRIAQRLTSLIALLPTSRGQTTKAGSLSVTVASDQTVDVNLATALNSSSDSIVAVGDVAAGSTDTTTLPPVAIGGNAASSPSNIYSNGQRAKAQFDLAGGQYVRLLGPSGLLLAAQAYTSGASDGTLQGNTYLNVVAHTEVVNGSDATKADRFRNNVSAVLLASGAQTTTQTSATLVNYNHSRLLWIINVTSAGTGSITPSFQVVDANGVATTVWTAASAITAGGTYTYSFVPGVATAASFTENIASGIPARSFKLVITANNANPMTYSSAYELGL